MLSSRYFLLSAKKKFVTNFVIHVTNFVIRVTSFVIHVTNFVTKNIVQIGKIFIANSKKSLRGNNVFSRLIIDNLPGNFGWAKGQRQKNKGNKPTDSKKIINFASVINTITDCCLR